MRCTLPRAPAVRALSEGIEGQQQGSFSGCLAAQTQRRTENTRLPGPLAGSAAPDNQRLSPWVPRECMTDVGSLALSSPAETCAGGWGLILRVGKSLITIQLDEVFIKDLNETMKFPH